MNIKYWMIVGVVFALLLVPFYEERHAIRDTFLSNSHFCPTVGYTSQTPTCSSQITDCFTTTNAGTVCTHTDIAALVAVGGLSLIAGCLMLLTSITVSYPISKRLGWL